MADARPVQNDETESMSSTSTKEEDEKIDVVEMTEESENKLLFPEPKVQSENNGDKSTVPKEESSIDQTQSEGKIEDDGDLDDRLLDGEDENGEGKIEEQDGAEQIQEGEGSDTKLQESGEDGNNEGEVKSEEETENSENKGEVKSDEETENRNNPGEVKSEDEKQDDDRKGEVKSEEESEHGNNEGQVKAEASKEEDESKVDPGEQLDNENELTTRADVHKEFNNDNESVDSSESQVIVVDDDPKLKQTCSVKIKGFKGKPTCLPGKKKKSTSAPSSPKPASEIPKGASGNGKGSTAKASSATKVRKVSESTLKKREKRRQAVATGKFTLESVQVIDLVDSSDEENAKSKAKKKSPPVQIVTVKKEKPDVIDLSSKDVSTQKTAEKSTMCRRRLSLRRYAEKAIQTESSRTEIYTELDNGEIVQVKSEPQGVTTTTTKSSQVDLPRKTKMMREESVQTDLTVGKDENLTIASHEEVPKSKDELTVLIKEVVKSVKSPNPEIRAGNTDQTSSRSSPINTPISLKDHTTTLDQGVTLSDDGGSSRLTGFTDSNSDRSSSPYTTTASGYFPGTEYSKQYTSSSSYMRPQAPIYGTPSYTAPFRFGVPGPVPQRLFANAALPGTLSQTYGIDDYLPPSQNQPQYTAAHGTFGVGPANAAHLVAPANQSTSYPAATATVTQLGAQMTDTSFDTIGTQQTTPANFAASTTSNSGPAPANMAHMGVGNVGMQTPNTAITTPGLYSASAESVSPIGTSTPQQMQQNVSADISVTSSADADAARKANEEANLLREGEDSLSKLSTEQVEQLKWKITLQELRKRNLRLPPSYFEKERLKKQSSESNTQMDKSRIHTWTEQQKLYAGERENENAIADDQSPTQEDDDENEDAGNISPVNSDDNNLLNQDEEMTQEEKDDGESDEDTEEIQSSSESDKETSNKDIKKTKKPLAMNRSSARTTGMSTRMQEGLSRNVNRGGAGGAGRPKGVQKMFDQANRDFNRAAAVQSHMDRKHSRLPPISEFRRPYVTMNPLTGPISVKRKLDDSNNSTASAEQKKLKAKPEVAQEDFDDKIDDSVDNSELAESGETPQSQSAQSLLHGTENTPTALNQSQASDVDDSTSVTSKKSAPSTPKAKNFEFYNEKKEHLGQLKEILNNFDQGSKKTMDDCNKLVEEYNRTCVNSKKDNNSFFNAANKQIVGYSGGKALRQAVINHISDNRLKYQFMIEHHVDGGNFYNYCRDMGNNTLPYDEICVIALADLLQREIAIVTPNLVWSMGTIGEDHIIVVMVAKNNAYGTRKDVDGIEKSDRAKGKANNVHKCWICKKRFVSADILVQHKLKHDKTKAKCTQCCKSFSTKFTLRNHIRTKHEGKLFVCSISDCKKKFQSKQALRDHIHIHDNSFKYTCELCGKGYMKSDHFNDHLLRHTKEKPFKCDKCGKSFTRKNELKRHLTQTCLPSNAPKVECSLCGRKLKNTDCLRNHRRLVHEEGEPKKCPYCDELTTFHQSTIDRHIKKKHPDKL